MYEVTSIPFVKRTRATLRSAEFGFLGVVVYTRTQTPRFWGHDMSAGAVVLRRCLARPLFINWLIVGIYWLRTSHCVAGSASPRIAKQLGTSEPWGFREMRHSRD